MVVSGAGGLGAAAVAPVLLGAAGAVFGEPVEAAVFFVGEEGGRGSLAEARGDGETAGAGADEEDVVDEGDGVGIGVGVHLGLEVG